MWGKAEEYAGIMVQNPDNFGNLVDYEKFAKNLKEKNVVFTIVCDLLSLSLTKPPGDMGADIAVGSA